MLFTTILAVCAGARAVWDRRLTWRVSWEMPTTFNVAAQSIEAALMSKPASRWLGPKLHAVTGLWNCEDLIGHLAYISGMLALTYMILSRLEMTDRQLRWLVRWRLELPMTMFYPGAIAMFILVGFADRYIECDLMSVHPTPLVRSYWLLYIAADSWLLYLAAQGLTVLRRDPEQRRTADVYMAAVALSALTSLLIAIDPSMTVSRFTTRMEGIGYAVAASYAWRQRVRYMRGCSH